MRTVQAFRTSADFGSATWAATNLDLVPQAATQRHTDHIGTRRETPSSKSTELVTDHDMTLPRGGEG